MPRKWTNYLFIITILFFILGFFNIIFAWMGLACMALPFILLLRDKRKTWCQGYCPRASFFNVLFRNRSLTGKPAPAWLTKGKAKWIMLGYFLFNLFVITMSTIMVFRGRREPLDSIRFLIAFQLPWDMPQLLNNITMPDWVLHLSFRLYSMMFTVTIIGIILGWVYRPRTWCTICPVNTLSSSILKKIN